MVNQKYPNVYDYILSEETNYRTNKIPLASNWFWNMFEHIERSFQLKNSQFYKGNNDYTRPFNNIIIPIANVNYRSEGFDVKDNEIYVDNKEDFYKSLIARKFHERWALKYSIDTAIDESVESYFDYGLALVKNVNDKRPEVVQLQQIAFCDQTDILSGPICLKHQYSINQLQEMKGKWDSNAIDDAILMSEFKKDVDDKEAKTPGKYVEVYELEGVFPESWLGSEKLGEDWEDTGKYTRQYWIVTFYIDPTTTIKNGITLFKGKQKETIFKAIKRDSIFGRACGRGGIEELFHPQMWTNSSMIHIQEMLEAVSKILYKSNSKKLKNQNLKSNKNQQVIELGEGETLDQLAVTAPNEKLFEGLMNKWEQIARTIGSASDPQLGLNPVSGTPLGTTEIVTQQGQGIHEYRRGKIATFWGEIYRDWLMKYLESDINSGDEWLDELSLEELQEVAEKVATKKSNQRIIKSVLEGKMVTPQEQEALKQVIKDEFMKGGRKRFIKIVADEFKNSPLSIKFTIAGKQKNLAEMTSKLNSFFRAIFNPAVIQAIQSNEGLSDLVNQTLESSGFSPVNFAKLTAQPMVEQPEQMSQMMNINQPIGA